MSGVEPGTVAVGQVRGRGPQRLFRGAQCWAFVDHADASWIADAAVTDVRPLIVLDLDRPDLLLHALKTDDPWRTDRDWQEVARQIEAQIKPPKPDEPMGDGAVVEDRCGYRWVRIAGPGDGPAWRHRGHNAREWDHVNAVRILSEGVPS